MYARMTFGLTNVGATFQIVMDVAFVELIDVIMVVYRDDLTTYSKKVEDHCNHLEIKFIKDLEYAISLNPKKCHFGVEEGKLLGHIVSKDGVIIDPTRVVAINEVPIPRTMKDVQYFLGQINCQNICTKFCKHCKTNYPDVEKGRKDRLDCRSIGCLYGDQKRHI